MTIVAPSSTCPDNTRAACRFRPELPPMSNPSFAATSRQVRNACSSVALTIPSTTLMSKHPGMESFPTPSVSQLPPFTSSAATPFTTWSQNTDPLGSAIRTLIFGFWLFKYRPVPLTVPPVLPPAMKCVTSPAVCFQISGPSVASYASALNGLLY